jgi:hypothetical protein
MPRQNDRGGAAIADTLGTRSRACDDGGLALEAFVVIASPVLFNDGR